jgi:hypothetical protein
MNKRQLKKLSKKNEVTKEDAQMAWNIVARYLNKRPELSFTVDNFENKNNEPRYVLRLLGEKEDIFVADTIRPWKIDFSEDSL